MSRKTHRKFYKLPLNTPSPSSIFIIISIFLILSSTVFLHFLTPSTRFCQILLIFYIGVNFLVIFGDSLMVDVISERSGGGGRRLKSRVTVWKMRISKVRMFAETICFTKNGGGRDNFFSSLLGL